MGSKAKVEAAESRARAAELVREALTLLEAAGASAAVFHIKLALAELERCPEADDGGAIVSRDFQGDAFAHAIGAMAAIVECTAQSEGAMCVEAIAKAMEDHGREIAPQRMGVALLLDHWAGIVRERGRVTVMAGRRDNCVLAPAAGRFSAPFGWWACPRAPRLRDSSR